MRKVLVTGATGFIGQYVVRELLQQGCRVVATSAHAEKAVSLPWFSQVEYIPFSLEQYEASTDYYQFFGKPGLLIHLAWEGLPNYRSSFHMEENLPRHAAFMENLLRHGLKDLLVTGTCFEYGMQEGCLREDMPVFPDNPYGMAKNELRKFLEGLQPAYDFVFKWVRLFYMYGKGQSTGSLLSQLEKALEKGDSSFDMSGGEQVRDFLPVEEVAAYIIKVALQSRVRGIINICSGQPITVKQFVVNYLASVNREITLNLGYYPYPDHEPMRFWGDEYKLHTIT